MLHNKILLIVKTRFLSYYMNTFMKTSSLKERRCVLFRKKQVEKKQNIVPKGMSLETPKAIGNGYEKILLSLVTRASIYSTRIYMYICMRATESF